VIKCGILKINSFFSLNFPNVWVDFQKQFLLHNFFKNDYLIWNLLFGLGNSSSSIRLFQLVNQLGTGPPTQKPAPLLIGVLDLDKPELMADLMVLSDWT
jgi:hypothetical protein